MSRHNRIQILSYKGTHVVRWTSQKEADRLLSDGEVKLAGSQYRIVSPFAIPPNSYQPSSSSISLWEMESNAGLHGEEPGVKEARSKIALWRVVGDTKAPRVF